jgi:Mrp family chromosome partitioning ATPase
MVDVPASARAEAFRLLCHRLKNEGDARWIGVMSPRGGPEAAQCAAELAFAYAESSSRKVLLIEVDTEEPSLAEVLGFAVPHCFALQVHDKFDGSAEPWRAVSLHGNSVHAMAVHRGLSQGERLSPQAFRTAGAELSLSSYGHIIAVCPKILDSASVALVSGTVQEVILAGVAGRTTSTDLHEAARQLSPYKVLAVALMQQL